MQFKQCKATGEAMHMSHLSCKQLLSKHSQTEQRKEREMEAFPNQSQNLTCFANRAMDMLDEKIHSLKTTGKAPHK